MCIASIITKSNTAILTFNRDEDPDRAFSDPELRENGSLFCPLDLVSGGTWIGKNDASIYCLQNGGRLIHTRQLPYDLSRGKILMDLLRKRPESEIFKQLQTMKVEPFTISRLDILDFATYTYIYDGHLLEKVKLENKATIRCSSTLYKPNISEIIASDFDATIHNEEDEILDFHLAHRIGGSANTYINKPATTSVTQFLIENGNCNCRFYNLISGKITAYTNI